MGFDDLHQQAGSVENADAMSKTSMGGTRIDQFGKSELLDPTKPLERARLYHFPQAMLELIGPELNQVVQRIAYSLGLWCFHGLYMRCAAGA